MIRLIPVESGFMTTDTANLCEGATGRIRIPVSCWLIQHPKGTVIFDTGLHADLVNDTALLGPLADVFDLEMETTLGTQIERREVDPGRIDYIVFSHLHFDHSGGTAAIPNARIVVQADEWQSGHDPALVDGPAYGASDYDLGHDVIEVRGFHDIFGDGSVVCVPTPGHTPGHQSLRVALESGSVLLVGDCCYWKRMLEEDLVPPFGFDRALQRQSMQTLRNLQREGVRLIYGHDPEQWTALGDRTMT